MASELDQLRTPSPLPADVLVRLHPQDPSDMRDWLVKISVIVNSTVPVNQLPPELLTEILQILRTDCPRDWSFVAVLLVCRHWYHAAVSSSRLWTKSARGMPLPLVETYLRRSRRAGLSLQVDTQAKCPEDSQDALLNMLFPHFDRVTHLETYSSQPYIKHHMRRLSFLSLHHDFSVHQSSSTIIVHGDDFSSLGSLSLGDFELKANIVDVHCLTSLTLDDMSCDTWDELFNLLRSSPALEHLAFGGLDIDAMAIPTDTRIRPILNLQYLKSFKFLHYGGHTAMSFLLAHLALPCTAKIKIDTYLDASGQVVHEDENADLHHGILIADIVPKDNITLPAFAAVQALRIEFGYCSFDVKAFTPEDLGPCRTDTTTITFSCYLADFFNLRSVQRQIMPELGTVFPRSLTVLHVRVEGGYCYDTRQDSIELWESWESLYYEVFLDLEEFHASGPTPDFFTDFLFDIGPSSPQLREFDSLPWPMLKRIKFEYTAKEQGELDKSEAVIKDIVTSICNRQAALEERLEHLALIFPEEPPNLRAHLGQLRGVTKTLVCNVGGHDLALDEGESVTQ